MYNETNKSSLYNAIGTWLPEAIWFNNCCLQQQQASTMVVLCENIMSSNMTRYNSMTKASKSKPVQVNKREKLPTCLEPPKFSLDLVEDALLPQLAPQVHFFARVHVKNTGKRYEELTRLLTNLALANNNWQYFYGQHKDSLFTHLIKNGQIAEEASKRKCNIM